MVPKVSLLSSLQAEYRAVAHISRTDLVQRLLANSAMVALCFVTADINEAYMVVGLILLSEVMMLACLFMMPERDEDISPVMIGVGWIVLSFSIIAYLTPSMILAGQGSVPLMLTGFLWCFGAFVHLSNVFSKQPYFSWSQLVPGTISAILVVNSALEANYAYGAQWEWWAPAICILIFGANLAQTLLMQSAAQHELNDARSIADDRLAALEHMARHDALTGLLNRRAFEDSVLSIVQERQTGSEIAIFLIDLDGFKPINDSYSHDAGDHVLAMIGKRLANAVADGGIAARFGGDEFAIAVPGMKNGTEAQAWGNKLLGQIEQPIDYEGRQLRVGASIGVGMTGRGNNLISALCAAADQAMYRAKGGGTAKVVCYNEDEFAPRVTLQDRSLITEALAAKEIGPHYQPKVDLRTGKLIGFEALARWAHPTNGLMLPSEFLPKIDQLGLQGDFLNHMAELVLKDVSALLNEGLDPGQVSINVPEVTLATYSARQDLDTILARNPEAKDHLTFEITEDVFIARSGNIIHESISHFRAQGVRISLDDFGTGFASFQHLRELEFDELKIDTSFVAGLGKDLSAEVLVEGFLSIAKGLGVDVIAEGVESNTQRMRLLELGARHGQGWRFGRAIPFKEVRARILAEHPNSDARSAG